MTSFTTDKDLFFPTSAIASIFMTAVAAIAGTFRTCLERRRERRRQRQAIAHLRSLPGHALRDIGIDRTEITSVVMHGREGR